MKRIGHLKEQIVSLDNIYVAFYKASRGKRHRKEVLRFCEQFDLNIRTLREEMILGTLNFGNYRFFTIRDPKVRIICSAPFRERIAQHAIMNICHPFFDRQLIETTYAARKGKGLYAAIDRAVQAMSHYEYCVKLDFRKFYDSIDHSVLKEKLKRMFKDKWLVDTFNKIIDSYEVTLGKGLPIGNLTSQYFANIYLSVLDHYVKEKWGISVYIRYMDDILLADNDSNKLKRSVNKMIEFSLENLKLSIKPPIYRHTKNGQIFLGYRVMPYHYKLSGRSKRRFRSKMLFYNKMLYKNNWTEEKYKEHILSLLAFVNHAVSYKFRRECMTINKGNN